MNVLHLKIKRERERETIKMKENNKKGTIRMDPLLAEEKRAALQSINLPFVSPSLKHELYQEYTTEFNKARI